MIWFPPSSNLCQSAKHGTKKDHKARAAANTSSLCPDVVIVEAIRRPNCPRAAKPRDQHKGRLIAEFARIKRSCQDRHGLRQGNECQRSGLHVAREFVA